MHPARSVRRAGGPRRLRPARDPPPGYEACPPSRRARCRLRAPDGPGFIGSGHLAAPARRTAAPPRAAPPRGARPAYPGQGPTGPRPGPYTDPRRPAPGPRHRGPAPSVPVSGAVRTRVRRPQPVGLFSNGAGPTGGYPQVRGSGTVHSLGTPELSQALSTDDRPGIDLRRWEGCGFVGNRYPQPGDKEPPPPRPGGLSTARPQAEQGYAQVSHRSVHCSTTRTGLSPGRVKGVTPRGGLGWGQPGQNLGMTLGTTWGCLWTACGQGSVVHRRAWLSTAAIHRTGG